MALVPHCPWGPVTLEQCRGWCQGPECFKPQHDKCSCSRGASLPTAGLAQRAGEAQGHLVGPLIGEQGAATQQRRSYTCQAQVGTAGFAVLPPTTHLGVTSGDRAFGLC